MLADTAVQVLTTVVCSHRSHHPRLASPPVTAVDSDPRVPLPQSRVSERSPTGVPHFHHQWGDSRLFPPSPSCYRRRRYGFGKASPLLSTAHSSSSPSFLVHLAWDWLSVTDRRSLASAMPAIATPLFGWLPHTWTCHLYKRAAPHRMLRQSAKIEHIAWPRPSFALIVTMETSSAG